MSCLAAREAGAGLSLTAFTEEAAGVEDTVGRSFCGMRCLGLLVRDFASGGLTSRGETGGLEDGVTGDAAAAPLPFDLGREPIGGFSLGSG